MAQAEAGGDREVLVREAQAVVRWERREPGPRPRASAGAHPGLPRARLLLGQLRPARVLQLLGERALELPVDLSVLLFVFGYWCCLVFIWCFIDVLFVCVFRTRVLDVTFCVFLLILCHFWCPWAPKGSPWGYPEITIFSQNRALVPRGSPGGFQGAKSEHFGGHLGVLWDSCLMYV